MTVISILKEIARQARKPRSPVDAFDEVIHAREERHAELRRAVLRILYMKAKLEGELVERRAEVARVYHAARTAARRGDDAACLALLSEKRLLEERLKRAEAGVAEARENAEHARRSLKALEREMRELVRERWERATALDAIALERNLQKIKNDERTLAEDEKLEAARLHIDRETAERDVDRRLRGDALLLDDPDLHDDTDLRIELARLKMRTRKFDAA